MASATGLDDVKPGAGGPLRPGAATGPGAGFATTVVAAAGAPRIPSLDTMRGLIMVIMAIDHARGFIAKNHPGEFWGSPLPDYGGDVLAFLTRLVTHLCAPGFFFLMGTGMALLAASRAQLGWSSGRITRHLAVRGLALILLGQLLENGAVMFAMSTATRVEGYGVRPPGASPTSVFLIFSVLYGLGASLILGGLLVRLRALGLIGVAAACLLALEWITPSASQAAVQFHPLLRLLFIPGQTGRLFVVYPAIAWLPCALLGMAFGHWLLRDRARAFARLGFAGALFLVLFIIVRVAGGFGNITAPVAGWIGFFNLVKYPPSLVFVLFTLGVNFLLLTAIERFRLGEMAWSRHLQVFGTVPLFFFIAHLWLYGAIGRFYPAGMPIPQMYPFWLLGLALLYFPCRWYGDFKRRRPADSFFRML